ncbi:BMP family ABC transporter substrate-binding protein [Mycoplasmatota bacterium]|nr:BMP family ABC transporter substrate-binding protein [Mycoplasmatota bacterium]
MKKILSIVSLMILALTLVACGNTSEDSVKRIAFITDPVGTNPFLTQATEKLEEIYKTGKYPMEYSIMESQDSGAWKDNVRAAVEEGYDLIIGIGWQSDDPMSQIAAQYPDKSQYVCIDVVCQNENIKSYTFKAEEGAFLIGAMAALVSDKLGAPDGPLGGVHVNPGQGSFPWRYGYMEGARTINPNLTMDDFIFNFTKSYTDAALAKELALSQYAQGAKFINAASAVADFGTFEAALEKGFYTSGQDADRTSPDNPYILSTQVKYTGVVTEMIVDEFFETGIKPEAVELGIAEGVIGAIYVTDDGTNPRNTDILTDEIVDALRELADKIKNGEITVKTPLETSYTF